MLGLKFFKARAQSHDGLVILAGAMPFTVVQTLKTYNVQRCPDGEAKHKTGAFSFSSQMNCVRESKLDRNLVFFLELSEVSIIYIANATA